MGWNLVSFKEADPDLDKEIHRMDMEDIRAYEKTMMQHNRCDGCCYV